MSGKYFILEATNEHGQAVQVLVSEEYWDEGPDTQAEDFFVLSKEKGAEKVGEVEITGDTEHLIEQYNTRGQ